jgi:hypothetical protein
MEGPEGVRHPVVLLDEAQRETSPFRDDAKEILELGVLVDERHRDDAESTESRSTRVARDA